MRSDRKGLRSIVRQGGEYHIGYEVSEKDYPLTSKKHAGFLNIHIKSAGDLSNAGWNYGKNGSGMTIKIASVQ